MWIAELVHGRIASADRKTFRIPKSTFGNNYSLLRPDAFAFAHRARAAAAIFALAAALNVRRGFELFARAGPPLAALYFAHRALCAAAIRARPAALILMPLLPETRSGALPPKTRLSSSCSDSIFSLTSASRRNCSVDRFNNSFIRIRSL